MTKLTNKEKAEYMANILYIDEDVLTDIDELDQKEIEELASLYDKRTIAKPKR